MPLAPGISMGLDELHQALQRRMPWLASAWGVAEAIFFFLVPDVIISLVGLLSFKRSFMACWWSLLGAMAGGVLMYGWGAYHPASALAFVDAVPFIPHDMLGTVLKDLVAHGAQAVLHGPLAGIPYKIYAVQAGALGVPLGWFLIYTVPARTLRFMIATVAFNTVSRLLGQRVSLRVKTGLWLLYWIGNYTVYWHINMRP